MGRNGPALPIDAIRGQVQDAARRGRLVVTSPTGSGKSTQVPRWCMAAGRVVVVEPRRVACRSLAQRVAELEGAKLGGDVGYVVRDDRRAGDASRLTFVTPGIALRMAAGGDLAQFATVIVDEFHERTLDVDLILALLLERRDRGLVVMSATLDGPRVAAHLRGVHLHAPGRTHPVDIRHLPAGTLLPDVRGLEERVCAALDAAGEHPGDVLVFLPGKGEISGVERALRGRRKMEVVKLHGGLSLSEQGAAFGPAPAGRRKVILATNVAETSVTIPGIGVVIDSGLVRRTRYHEGRGYLSLVAVAADSADQRAGRAGRMAAGICYRLWDEAARLERMTPPEVHRESLVPLMMAAAACGADPAALPFLDPPKEHALASARQELIALGALDPADANALTTRGRRIFGLPLDAHLGRLLVEAEAAGGACLADACDLVGALGVDRPLFRFGPRPEAPADDLRRQGCDAVALIRAVREGDPRRHGLSDYALGEARRSAQRLRAAFDLPSRGGPGPIDRRRLAMVALTADPRAAHVARRRKKWLKWSNGGTEIELGRESAIDGSEVEKGGIEAIVVLASRALGAGTGARAKDSQILATAAMPLPVKWMIEAGLGRDRLAATLKRKGRLLARIERVYARKVLHTREAPPEGAIARELVAGLFLDGRLFSDEEALATAKERLERAGLWRRLADNGDPDALLHPWSGPRPVPTLPAWVSDRLEALGLQSGDDLQLLSASDLLPPPLPEQAQASLDRHYPAEIDVGDARYKVRYDLGRREVLLDKVAGQRKSLPPAAFIPPFTGFTVLVKDRNQLRVLRG